MGEKSTGDDSRTGSGIRMVAPGTLAPMPYAVVTPVFEGPFDLLLHLILKQEVELWEISLAEIVDAYLNELERMDELDLDVATEFLLIAATLVELKARRLLPGIDEVELDEELLRFEERDLLLGEELAKRLGMRPFRLADERKAVYHLSAVIGCNLLVALESENTGKPVALTLSEEIPPMVDQIRFFAGAARIQAAAIRPTSSQRIRCTPAKRPEG